MAFLKVFLLIFRTVLMSSGWELSVNRKKPLSEVSPLRSNKQKKSKPLSFSKVPSSRGI